jgi:hypothetical protein
MHKIAAITLQHHGISAIPKVNRDVGYSMAIRHAPLFAAAVMFENKKNSHNKNKLNILLYLKNTLRIFRWNYSKTE